MLYVPASTSRVFDNQNFLSFCSVLPSPTRSICKTCKLWWPLLSSALWYRGTHFWFEPSFQSSWFLTRLLLRPRVSNFAHWIDPCPNWGTHMQIGWASKPWFGIWSLHYWYTFCIWSNPTLCRTWSYALDSWSWSFWKGRAKSHLELFSSLWNPRLSDCPSSLFQTSNHSCQLPQRNHSRSFRSYLDSSFN